MENVMSNMTRVTCPVAICSYYHANFSTVTLLSWLTDDLWFPPLTTKQYRADGVDGPQEMERN